MPSESSNWWNFQLHFDESLLDIFFIVCRVASTSGVSLGTPSGTISSSSSSSSAVREVSLSAHRSHSDGDTNFSGFSDRRAFFLFTFPGTVGSGQGDGAQQIYVKFGLPCVGALFCWERNDKRKKLTRF